MYIPFQNCFIFQADLFSHKDVLTLPVVCTVFHFCSSLCSVGVLSLASSCQPNKQQSLYYFFFFADCNIFVDSSVQQDQICAALLPQKFPFSPLQKSSVRTFLKISLKAILKSVFRQLSNYNVLSLFPCAPSLCLVQGKGDIVNR